MTNMEQVCVGDLMHPGVRTVSKSAPLLDAGAIMHELGVSSLIVERDHVHDAYGILTRKDIVEALASGIGAAEPILVEDVMTKPAITVWPELSLNQCLRLMRMAGVRRVPVQKDGQLVGILSNTDVFRWLIEQSLKTG